MKNIVLIIVSIFILTACNKDSNEPNNLEQSLIGTGSLYGNGEEGIHKGNFIIEKEYAWNDLLAKINLTNNESQNFSETEIDFNKFIVLAVFDEVLSSGGHSIQIEELTETNDAIEALVSRSSPTGGISATVMTQPFYISKIEKPNRNIVFKE